MNVINLMGRLTRDPEYKTFGDNSRFVVVGLAVDNKYKKRATGEMVDEPTFVDCKAWDTGADTIAKWFKKGDPMAISGELKLETWTNKEDGGKRSKLVVRINRFWFVPGYDYGQKINDGPRRDDRTEPLGVGAGVDDGDSIPF